MGKELHILSSFSSGDGPLKSYVLSRLSAVTFFSLFVQIGVSFFPLASFN